MLYSTTETLNLCTQSYNCVTLPSPISCILIRVCVCVCEWIIFYLQLLQLFAEIQCNDNTTAHENTARIQGSIANNKRKETAVLFELVVIEWDKAEAWVSVELCIIWTVQYQYSHLFRYLHFYSVCLTTTTTFNNESISTKEQKSQFETQPKWPRTRKSTRIRNKWFGSVSFFFIVMCCEEQHLVWFLTIIVFRL